MDTAPTLCPFCGMTPDFTNDGILEEQDHFGAIACAGCGARGPQVPTVGRPVEEWYRDAVESWNKRVEAPWMQ